MKSKGRAFLDGMSAVVNPHVDLTVSLPEQMQIDMTKSISQKSIESIRKVVMHARREIERDVIRDSQK